MLNTLLINKLEQGTLFEVLTVMILLIKKTLHSDIKLLMKCLMFRGQVTIHISVM